MTTTPDRIVAATGDGVWRMELSPAWGGALNSLQYCGAGLEPLELLAGHASDADFANDRFYRNVPLWPWVNRLADGRYRHLGTEYSFPINEPATRTALHGFLFRLPVTAVERTFSLHDAAITLRYDYAGDNPGYPFATRIQLRYAVHRDGLTLSIGVRNHHTRPVPVGVGWHPYLSLAQTVDELALQLPPARRVLVDQRLLPAGETEAFDSFRQSQLIGDLQQDHCFVLDQGPGPTVATRLWSARRQLGLELWQRRADYPFVHVFIPPDRRSIALEPVSCNINAFNAVADDSGAGSSGLRVLAPGATLTAQCGIRVFTALHTADR